MVSLDLVAPPVNSEGLDFAASSSRRAGDQLLRWVNKIKVRTKFCCVSLDLRTVSLGPFADVRRANESGEPRLCRVFVQKVDSKFMEKGSSEILGSTSKSEVYRTRLVCSYSSNTELRSRYFARDIEESESRASSLKMYRRSSFVMNKPEGICLKDFS
ncbi:hypothetical protein KM043_018135 [Ampulex compressa]|nr:hypothetical protein KM043_018135 [Ampulex compressa]